MNDRTRPTMARWAAMALLVGALLAAGCGGDGDDGNDATSGYELALREAFAPVGQALAEADEAREASSRKAATALESAIELLSDARRDTLALDPPADLADEQRDMLVAVEDYRADLEVILKQAEAGDPDATKTVQAAAEDFAKDVAVVKQRLTAAGVEFNGGGGG